MSTQVVRGDVITPDALSPDTVVEIDGATIAAVRPPRPGDPPPTGDLILPGLVDVHCHGAAGASFAAPDDDHAAAVRHHLAHGTTTLVASTVSDDPARMIAAVEALAPLAEAGEIAGVHVEGPFIATACRGAHDPAVLLPPDRALTDALLSASGGHLVMMTLAPELPGAEDLARQLIASGVIAAAGHTAADGPTLRRFLDLAPIGHVTHLFNGMPPAHHRTGETAWSAVAAGATRHARLELIADGVHVGDTVAAAVFDSVGAEHIVLVTDAMAAAGMPDGSYRLGPLDVTVADGVARLDDGGSIAGGTSTLLQIVTRLVRAGVDPVAAVHSASSAPAAALGRSDIGAVADGLRADLVIVDDAWNLRHVLRAGRRVPDDRTTLS